MTATQPTRSFTSTHELLAALNGLARIDGTGEQAHVTVLDDAGFRDGLIDRLIATAVFGEGAERDTARWIIRAAAPALGAAACAVCCGASAF